jgi:hypothetical protein
MYWFMKFGIFIGRAQAANRPAQQYRHHSSERIELKPLHAIFSSCAQCTNYYYYWMTPPTLLLLSIVLLAYHQW